MVMTAIRTVIAAVTAMIFPRIELGRNFFIIRIKFLSLQISIYKIRLFIVNCQ